MNPRPAIYYNDHDRKVCAWLRELIRAGHLPAGVVDDRPIQALTGADLAGFTHVHLFAGIGGWPLALELAGWPANEPVWTLSCPCQPFSGAGLRLGTKDPRHLWPEALRLVTECLPPTLLGEQVASNTGRAWLNRVFADVEKLGYAAAGADLCSAGAGAPHIRQRLWWGASARPKGDMAHPRGDGRPTRLGHSETGDASPIGPSSGNGHLAHNHCGGRPPGQSPSAPDGHGVPVGPSGGHGHLGNPARDDQWRDPQPGNDRERLPPGGSSGPLHLDHAASYGLPRRPENLPPETGSPAGSRAGGQLPDGFAGPSLAGDLSDAHGPGCREQWRAQPNDPPHPAPECHDPWGDYDLCHFTDGKTRRVEPGTFPLAHGVPCRVVRLRGYSNAINPHNAAQFIRAFRSAIYESGDSPK